MNSRWHIAFWNVILKAHKEIDHLCSMFVLVYVNHSWFKTADYIEEMNENSGLKKGIETWSLARVGRQFKIGLVVLWLVCVQRIDSAEN